MDVGIGWPARQPVANLAGRQPRRAILGEQGEDREPRRVAACALDDQLPPPALLSSLEYRLSLGSLTAQAALSIGE